MRRPARPAALERVRIHHVLIGLVVAHVLLKIGLAPRALPAGLIGDEAYYVDSGRALGNLLRDLGSFSAPDTAELERSVVGSGWFMPGMSVVLAPLFLLVPDAPTEVVRIYLGLVSTLLLLLAAAAVRRTFGDVAAAALLVFPGLVPMWVLFSYAAWGDLSAGLVVVVLLCEVVRLFRGYVAGVAPTWRDGVRFGLLGIVTLYFRSSTQPLLLGLLVLSVLGLVVLLRGRERRRALLSAAATVAVFLVLLAPWAVSESVSLGSRLTTTTTVPTALANTFGDRDEVCYGPCDPDSTKWFAPLRYARETARVTGRGEAEVLEEMSVYARQDVTATGYSYQVLTNFKRYLLEPSGYEDWFRAGDHDDLADLSLLEQVDGPAYVIHGTTFLLYFPALLAGVGVMLVAVRRSRDTQLVVIGLKLFIAALMLQPFVHLCTSRYWPTFGPLFAIAAVVLLQVVRRRRAEAAEGPAGEPLEALDRWLFRIQVLLSAGFALVVAGLVALAALS